MNLKFRLGALGVFLLSTSLAHAEGEFYLSASAGKFDHDATSLTVATSTAGSTTTTSLMSASDESDLTSVGWGVADESARFLFEYYYQNTDLSGFAAEYTKHSLFYSGYWTPNLYVPKLHGILGAGVGVAELSLDSDDARIGNEFKDREVQYKIAAGIEYRLLDLLTIYGTYEKHYTSDFSHWIATNRRVDLKDADQTVLQIGVAARF